MVSSIKRTNQATYITAYACCCVCVSGWLMGIVMCRQGAIAFAIVDRVVLVEEMKILLKPTWTYQEHIIGVKCM
jgi:hypothetical protein